MTSEQKPLILIVDDTPTNIQILAENLETDYRIKVASSGKAALDVISKQEAPDLILLDVMMPIMDGYEVCSRLKRDPATSNIPVIFVTAMNDGADEERGLMLGAVDYITKPFHLPIVRARIRNHVQLKLMTDLLESMAWIDCLTGIPNRRRFDHALEAEWKRAQRAGSSLALILVDVDHFKDYNDHHGHSAGDVCLKRVASTLASSITRAGDLAARYGGEEFVLLLPETDIRGVRQFAEQLCLRTEEQQLPHGSSSTSPWVTMSAGYAAVVPSQDGTAAELLEEADRMLYQAKSAGRNRAYGAGD